MRIMAVLKGFKTEELIFVIFLVLTVLSFKTKAAARQCCSMDNYLPMGAKLCSDNKPINLSCPKGILFIDDILTDDEKKSLDPNETLSVFDEGIVAEDLFCIAKIQRNDTYHMVALVCYDGEHQSQMDIVLRILMIISTLFLLVTVFIYLALPNLRDLQGKCVIIFVCCYITFYVALLAVQMLPVPSDPGCTIQAAVLYFSITATFFWNNIITFNIWKAIRKASHKIKQKSLSIIYLLWGFGIPILMVTVSLILNQVPDGNHIRPSFGETRCWFKGKLELWSYFYGPISIVLLLNTIMFLQSVWLLWKSFKTSSNSKLRSLRFQCFMYLRLFLVMGVTWIFEVISFATNSHGSMKYLWFVMDCLNSAQGVLIFLLLVVFRQKVRRGIVKNKLLNINCPQSWTREEIQESSTESVKEEFELPGQKAKMFVESQK